MSHLKFQVWRAQDKWLSELLDQAIDVTHRSHLSTILLQEGEQPIELGALRPCTPMRAWLVDPRWILGHI